jgi:WD40 repeat protein
LILAGHTQQVTDVDYSADGKRVLTAGEDGMVYVWSTLTGSRLSSLTVGSPVRSARFSPDMHHILIGQAGGSVAIWDAVSGRRIMELRKAGGLQDRPSAAYAPDGEIFLTDLSGTKVYDSAGKTVRRVREATGDTLAIGSDGSRFLTHGFIGPIRNWRSDDGKLLATLQQDHDLAGGVQFSPDMAFILTVFSERVEIFDSATGQLLLTLSERTPIRSALFSPTQPQISTATVDGRVKVWNFRRESRRPAEIEQIAGRFLRSPHTLPQRLGGS